MTDQNISQIQIKTSLAVLSLGSVMLLSLILLDSGISGASLFILGMLLGAVFLNYSYGFASGWRQFLLHGNGIAVATHFVLIGCCAVIFIGADIVGAGQTLTLAPVSISLVLGAFIFGIGMQLANGCGSGVLFSLGGGSGRMVIALPFFVLGSVLGSVMLPHALEWGAVNPVQIGADLPAFLRLCVNLLLIGLAIFVFARMGLKRGFRWQKSALLASVIIALLCGCVYFIAGHGWGVTFGFTLWGAKIAQVIGFDIDQTVFWSWTGPARALSHSVLADTSSVMNIGLLIGASATAIWQLKFAQAGWPSFPQICAAACGGLLMGVGARLGFGCNIGAFLGGIASGSVHGWVWFICAMTGSSIGIILRKNSGFSDNYSGFFQKEVKV